MGTGPSGCLTKCVATAGGATDEHCPGLLFDDNAKRDYNATHSRVDDSRNLGMGDQGESYQASEMNRENSGRMPPLEFERNASLDECGATPVNSDTSKTPESRNGFAIPERPEVWVVTWHHGTEAEGQIFTDSEGAKTKCTELLKRHDQLESACVRVYDKDANMLDQLGGVDDAGGQDMENWVRINLKAHLAASVDPCPNFKNRSYPDLPAEAYGFYGAEASLDGQWVTPNATVDITDLQVTFPDGYVTTLEQVSDGSYDYMMTYLGDDYYAKLQPGKLVWDDDDVWIFKVVQELQVMFEPGDIGIEVDWHGGIVTRIDDAGKAYGIGVREGMRLIYIEGQDYTKEIYDVARAGKEIYEVTLVQEDLDLIASEIDNPFGQIAMMGGQQTAHFNVDPDEVHTNGTTDRCPQCHHDTGDCEKFCHMCGCRLEEKEDNDESDEAGDDDDDSD